MRLGVGTYTYPRLIEAGNLDPRGLLRRAADLGCDAVQFCENLPLWDRPDRDALRREAEDLGLTVEIGLRGLDPDRILAAAEFGAGAGFLRLVVDDAGFHPSPQEVEDRLGPLVERAATIIAVENHDRFPAAVLAGLLRSTGARATVDAANSLGCLEGVETVLTHLGPLAVCVHLKDVVATRKPGNLGFDVVGTATGEGGIPVPALLAGCPHAVSMTVEFWTPEGSDEDAMAARSVAYARAVRP